MEVLYSRCAGVDVHQKNVVVSRIIPGPDGQPLQEIRTFTTMTRDLLALSDWLAEGGVTHVAMESTGVYWKPVYNLLEGTFTLLLVNAAHIKQVPGRKSDVKDCAWIADLLRHGLLKGSFVPDRGLRELRELTRYRTALVRERAAEQNRVHKTLEGANIKLSAVATDLMGVSARQMLAALCTGRSDTEAIAQLAKGRLREKIPLLEQALEGDFQPHQRFLVAQQLAHIDYLEGLIDQVSEEVAQRLEPLAPPPSGPAPAPGSDALDEAAAFEGVTPRGGGGTTGGRCQRLQALRDLLTDLVNQPLQVVDVRQLLGDQEALARLEVAFQRLLQERDLLPQPAFGQLGDRFRIAPPGAQGRQHLPRRDPHQVGRHRRQLDVGPF